MKKYRIIKTVLVVLLSFLLVVTSGVFIYGITEGTQKEIDNSSVAMLQAPAEELLLSMPANKVDMVAVKESTSMGKAEKVANMIVDASYNNILIHQFYYAAHVEVHGGGKESYSDYYRAKTGANMFYQTFAYTGVLNPAQVKIDYVDQRLIKQTTTKYDKETKKFSVSLKKPSIENDGEEVTLPELNPYNIYSWYDFPLDLGGVKSCNSKNGATPAGRTEAIDYSTIDANSVKIEEVGTENPYYKLTFKANIDAAQASQETRDRFAESFNSLKNVQFYDLSFTVEIWKETGVFRQIAYTARVIASINGDRGEANISKVLSFSYDDEDCSVANHIKKLADQYDQKWITELSSKNQAILREELAELEAKLEAKKAAETEPAATTAE